MTGDCRADQVTSAAGNTLDAAVQVFAQAAGLATTPTRPLAHNCATT
ncbi:hypothetical protein [Micromonospora viridifaciens]|nr:hypothetical protein [Micromonospora viridifaciens]